MRYRTIDSLLVNPSLAITMVEAMLSLPMLLQFSTLQISCSRVSINKVDADPLVRILHVSQYGHTWLFWLKKASCDDLLPVLFDVMKQEGLTSPRSTTGWVCYSYTCSLMIRRKEKETEVLHSPRTFGHARIPLVLHVRAENACTSRTSPSSSSY